MKQTLGRQVGEVREHECNMHVCVGVGSYWLKLLQTILFCYFNFYVNKRKCAKNERETASNFQLFKHFSCVR